MAEIASFKGIRYNADLSARMRDLVAPPYDVIGPDLQEGLYARHEHNVVRLDFGRVNAGDTAADNRYTRASGYLADWLDKGVLVAESAPSLYFYEVSYRTPEGIPRRMTGFICMLRLEEWDRGVVLPHEGTLKGPKADRMELLKATGASASQVFALYSDPEAAITRAMNAAADGRGPDEEAIDDDGALHRLWAVSDPGVIETARAVMSGKTVFIADGHHRYETALAYRDCMRGRGRWKGGEPYNFVPMFLSNMDEDGLTILPTHRLVKGPSGHKLYDMLKKASDYFDIAEIPFGPDGGEAARRSFIGRLEEGGKSAHVFGFYLGGRPSYYLFRLKDVDPIQEALRCCRSEVYCRLDVSILHSLVLERVLGIDAEAVSEERVRFEKDGERAIARVAAGEFEMCFLLNPTKVSEVKAVALAGEIMPQKSTYFYPKLLTGLVIARLV